MEHGRHTARGETEASAPRGRGDGMFFIVFPKTQKSTKCIILVTKTAQFNNSKMVYLGLLKFKAFLNVLFRPQNGWTVTPVRSASSPSSGISSRCGTARRLD